MLKWCSDYVLKLSHPTNYYNSSVYTILLLPYFYWLKWLFLWSRLKKDLLQEGHTNPTPRCTLHTCVQMITWEVDGPSLQPSTWHQYTHLMPPAEYKGVAYWWEWPPLKLEEQLERQPSLPGLQDQGHQVLWTPEGADGRWCRMGCGRLSYEEGAGDTEEYNIAPHRSP